MCKSNIFCKTKKAKTMKNVKCIVFDATPENNSHSASPAMLASTNENGRRSRALPNL